MNEQQTPANIASREWDQSGQVAIESVRAGNVGALWSLIESYLQEERKTRQLSPHTVRSYRRSLDTLFQHWSGETLLQADEAEAQALIDTIAGERGDSSTLRVHLAAFRLLFRALQWAGVTAANPFDGVQIERGTVESERARYSESDRVALLRVADAVDRVLILLLVDAGLSVAESVAVQWDSVDLTRREILIQPGYQRSTRSVPISDQLAAALRDLPRTGQRLLTFGTDARARQRMQQLCQRAHVPYRGVHALRGVPVAPEPAVAEMPARPGRLDTAMARDQIRLHYLPVMQVRTGAIEGVEVLVRWEQPNVHSILPDDFFPDVEQLGLIKQLNSWILSASLQQWNAWDEAGLRLRLSVNLSAQTIQDPRLPASLERTMTEMNIDPYRLVIEIADTALAADPHRSVRVLSQLRDMGIGIGLDHFGVGTASLLRLSRLPLDEIKIARPLIHCMTAEPERARVVESLIELGHSLDLTVGAVGVEDEATLDALVAMGCDTVQGFHLCPPLPAGDVEQWLRGLGSRLSLVRPSIRQA